MFGKQFGNKKPGTLEHKLELHKQKLKAYTTPTESHQLSILKQPTTDISPDEGDCFKS